MTCGDKFKADDIMDGGLDEGLEAGLELDRDLGIFVVVLPLSVFQISVTRFLLTFLARKIQN